MSTRESDALERWCPFTRGAWARDDDSADWRATGDAVGFNRALVRPGRREISVGKCIGSRCMAWRSTGTIEIGEGVAMIGLTEKRRVSRRERVGGCGLAGPIGLSDAELEAQRL